MCSKYGVVAQAIVNIMIGGILGDQPVLYIKFGYKIIRIG